MREKDIERGREREREGDWVKKEKVSERGWVGAERLYKAAIIRAGAGTYDGSLT